MAFLIATIIFHCCHFMLSTEFEILYLFGRLTHKLSLDARVIHGMVYMAHDVE